MVVNSNRFNFAEVVKKYLNEYGDYTVGVMTEEIPKVAKEAAKKLRQTSPKRTGEYARNWKSRVETGRLAVVATVYGDKPTYSLAHLLEHGHAKRGGGREVGKVEHIAPVEQWAVDEAENRIIERLERETR